MTTSSQDESTLVIQKYEDLFHNVKEYNDIENKMSYHCFEDLAQITLNSQSQRISFLVYIQCFDTHQSYFRNEFIPSNIRAQLRWLIITDCNISCSTKILISNEKTIKFPQLIGIDLSFNNISDLQAIAHIINHDASPQLTYLDLSHNPIGYQKDLRQKILTLNPNISVINRKRITPHDFVDIFTSNPSLIKTYGYYQSLSAFKTIPKSRYSITKSVCSSFNITEIDFSNCSLYWFKFALFTNATKINLSNNELSDQYVLFQFETNTTLRSLDISGNQLLTSNSQFLNKIKTHFPNAIVTEDQEQQTNNPEETNEEEGLSDFSTALKDYPIFLDLENNTPAFYIGCNNENSNFTFLNKKCRYLNKEKVKLKLKPFFPLSNRDIRFLENPPNSYQQYQNPNEILSLMYELKLFKFKTLTKDEFELIFKSCPLLDLLEVKLDLKQIPNLFENFESNIMGSLYTLSIDLLNFSFKSVKSFRKFIKNFRNLSNLCNLNLRNYKILKNEQEEIDTVFKYLRHLQFYNNYRNLMPPTVIQYFAARKVAEEFSNDISNDTKFDDPAFDAQIKHHTPNHNYPSKLLIRQESINTFNTPDYSTALPIKTIRIANLQNCGINEIKQLKPEELIDRHPRCNDINGKFTVEQNRILQLNDENEFARFTDITNSVLNLIGKAQMFYLYSVVTPIPLFSAMLYFIHSLLFKINRYFHLHNFVITDFMSKFEGPAFLLIFVILALYLQRSFISYDSFIKFSEVKLWFRILLIIVIVGGGGLLFVMLDYIDRTYFEMSNQYNSMYVLHYFLYLFIMFILLWYFYRHIFKQSKAVSSNTFLAYQEFKLFKTETAYSILVVSILPLMSWAFDSYVLWKLIPLTPILCFILYTFTKQIKEKCDCFIDMLGLNNDSYKGNENVQIHERKDEQGHVLSRNRILLIAKQSGKKVSIDGLLYGAFHYKQDERDEKFHTMVVKYRQSSQILYKRCRYRGFQKYIEIVDILSRILAEFTTHYFEEYQFIPPLLFLLYIIIWWPSCDTFDNVIMSFTHLSQVFQTIASSTFITSIKTQSYLMLVGTIFNFTMIVLGTFENPVKRFCYWAVSYLKNYIRCTFIGKTESSSQDSLFSQDVNMPLFN